MLYIQKQDHMAENWENTCSAQFEYIFTVLSVTFMTTLPSTMKGLFTVDVIIGLINKHTPPPLSLSLYHKLSPVILCQLDHQLFSFAPPPLPHGRWRHLWTVYTIRKPYSVRWNCGGTMGDCWKGLSGRSSVKKNCYLHNSKLFWFCLMHTPPPWGGIESWNTTVFKGSICISCMHTKFGMICRWRWKWAGSSMLLSPKQWHILVALHHLTNIYRMVLAFGCIQEQLRYASISLLLSNIIP